MKEFFRKLWDKAAHRWPALERGRRQLRVIASDLPDHRFAIIVLIYAGLIFAAACAVGADFPGVNEFFRARSPERAMLYLKSQQPNPVKEVNNHASSGVAKDSHGASGSKK